MNPADLGMSWLNQFEQTQQRMIIDDSTNYYIQPTIGMSVMDDIGHQTSTMVSIHIKTNSLTRDKMLNSPGRLLFVFFLHMIKHETHTHGELTDDSTVEFGLEGDCCQNLINESVPTFTTHTFLDASH